MTNGELRITIPETPPTGRYIYCITDSDAAESFGPTGISGMDRVAPGPEAHPDAAAETRVRPEVWSLGFNGIGAVISASEVKEYQRNRDSLLAHERAIEAVMKTHTVLPARFSIVAEDEAMVLRILTREHDRFVELLDGVRGKVEVGLKAIFEETAVCRQILERYSQIREMKARVAKLPPQRSYAQRIEIGRMVESALKQEKDAYREEILNALSPLALDVKTNGVWNDKMILNAAFLIERPRAPDFDQRVEQLAGRYGDQVQFKLVDSMPPFNFVNLAIDTREYRGVSA
jgi:hypothetical protein